MKSEHVLVAIAVWTAVSMFLLLLTRQKLTGLRATSYNYTEIKGQSYIQLPDGVYEVMFNPGSFMPRMVTVMYLSTASVFAEVYFVHLSVIPRVRSGHKTGHLAKYFIVENGKMLRDAEKKNSGPRVSLNDQKDTAL